MLILLLLITVIFTNCDKAEIAPDVPECIAEKIEEFHDFQRTLEDCEDAQVTEYRFRGDLVYLFSTGSCIADGATDVLNTACDTICSLGGFTGNLACDGMNFSGNSELVRVVYPN